MKTGNQTTYILLERGNEDVLLYEELWKLRGAQFPGVKEFYSKYPMITELMQGLRDEIEKQ